MATRSEREATRSERATARIAGGQHGLQLNDGFERPAFSVGVAGINAPTDGALDLFLHRPCQHQIEAIRIVSNAARTTVERWI